MVIQHMDRTKAQSAKFYYLAGLFSFNVLLSNSAFSGEVSFVPSVELKESYSDNILLAPKGQEQGEFVTEIAPAFNLLMQGAHFNANVNYRLQHLLYLKESNRNQTNNQLSANSNAELVDDYFFLDLNANHTQQIINAEQPVGNNNISVTSNRSDVTSYNIAPYFKHSFRNIMDATLRYSYSEVDYRRDELVDSSQNGYSLKLNSPTNLIGFSWGLDYTKQKNDLETGNDSEFKRGGLQLGYRFTTRTHVYASAGKDENTFAVTNNQDIDESYWNVGLDWKPGARDSISFQYGERFFGHTGQFSWRHNARRLVFNANYEEELSTAALSLLQAQQLGDTTSQQDFNQTLDTSNSISSQVFVRENGTLGLSYTFSKTSLSLSYSNERRKFQSSGDFTRSQNVNATISLRSSALVTYVFGSRWTRAYSSSTEAKIFNLNLDFSIQRKLTQRLQAELSIIHGVRHSSNFASDYEENIISLGITQTFN